MIEKIAGDVSCVGSNRRSSWASRSTISPPAPASPNIPLTAKTAKRLLKTPISPCIGPNPSAPINMPLCTQEMKEDVLKSMMLTNSLYRALDRGEFSVVYQPQVRLDTGEVCGAEALIRWQHPKLGNIPPDIFIPLAEKNGLINILGEWVLRSACIQNRKWQGMGCQHCRIAVNLSAVQLRNPHLVETVEDDFSRDGCSAGAPGAGSDRKRGDQPISYAQRYDPAAQRTRHIDLHRRFRNGILLTQAP